MADTAGPEGGAPEAGAGQAVQTFRLVAQYVKDLSFENPNAPEIYIDEGSAPQISVNVDVQARPVARADHYEVTLRFDVEATSGERMAFLIELSFGGLYHLAGLTDEHVRPVLLIEGPRMLFPFARRILADLTRECGFPPLLIQPIDFLRLYNEKIQPSTPPPVDDSVVSGS